MQFLGEGHQSAEEMCKRLRSASAEAGVQGDLSEIDVSYSENHHGTEVATVSSEEDPKPAFV